VTGDILVLVNKTGAIGENGDVNVGLNVQKNASGIPYQDWVLPSHKKNDTYSWVNDPI